MKQLFTAALLLVLTSLPAMAAETKENKNKKLTECVAVELYRISPKFANKGKQPEQVTKIPDGWTLVGSAGGGGHPTMLVCR